MSRRIANIGMLTALAMIFSYVEMLIPINFGIPGVKLGIANLVIVVGLYMMREKDVLIISLLRIILMNCLFGNGISLLYSLSGGILSFAVMTLAKRIKGFSISGISVAGAVSHNAGQIIAAAIVIGNKSIFYYFPVLTVAGVITGLFIGLLSARILVGIKGYVNFMVES